MIRPLADLDSQGLLASAVVDVVDGLAVKRDGEAELVGASRLVALGGVGHLADLVVAPGADGVDDVVEGEVAADPGAGGAAVDVVHRVGGGEGELAGGLLDDRGALGRVDGLVGGVDGAALYRVLHRRPTGYQVVPGVVRDVVGAARLVDLEQGDRASVGRHPHTDVVASGERRPVRHPVHVDLASQHADRGRVLVVRRHLRGAGRERPEVRREGRGRAGSSHAQESYSTEEHLDRGCCFCCNKERHVLICSRK